MSDATMSTASLAFKDLIRRLPPTSPWTGRSIMVRHTLDGSVIATSRGLTAMGISEAEALDGLAKLVATARLEPRYATVDTNPAPIA
jgi:hypothetical protein